MDKTLYLRYSVLFEAYENGNLGILTPIKERLRHMVNDRVLRPDAALYLISNFDIMLARPYFGQVYALSNGELSDLEPILSREKAQDTLGYALNTVLESLEGEQPYSSHAVSRAVERAWDSLSSLFDWA